ncbi:PQQ-dependent sugar dehydrogenase [Rhizobacter sp. LjRoot28]|uniref:PQQ-dependent sugar dehydrogenase n=1 Tax=Rhizobacter sp. LjRoot28 TaxID=3342309 RepID=UPI003ED001A2
MTSPSRTRLLALWASAAVVLSACGGGSDGIPAPVQSPPPPASGTPPGGVDGGGGGGSDKVVPTATLTAPAALADDLTGTLQVTADATDNIGVASVEFQVDGITVGSPDTAAPYAVTVNTADHAAGQHVVRARSRDAAGNVSAWSAATVRFGGTTAVAKGFTKTDGWVSGLTSATAMAQLPDGRLLVAQQTGQLRLVKNGQLVPGPLASFTVDPAGERGLIGVAVHPKFSENGWVYVHYTAVDNGAHGRISRVTMIGDAAAGEEVLVDLPALQAATNHNGGAIHFGPGDKLYVAVGDNADRTQAGDLDKVFGKILRFNDDGSYPADNPYLNRPGQAKAVWARGLRNPFTFGIQPGTGTLYINDVGENTWEEINIGAKGAHYGWPATEGPTDDTSYTSPVFAYKQTATVPPGSGPGGFFTGQSIVGAAFYPAGGPFPAAYHGGYFFADYVSRFVGRLDPANGHAAYSFARLSQNPVDVLAGNDGALYVLGRASITRITAP